MTNGVWVGPVYRTLKWVARDIRVRRNPWNPWTFRWWNIPEPWIVLNVPVTHRTEQIPRRLWVGLVTSTLGYGPDCFRPIILWVLSQLSLSRLMHQTTSKKSNLLLNKRGLSFGWGHKGVFNFDRQIS